MRFSELNLKLPNWVEPFLDGFDTDLSTTEQRMKLVIELSRENFKKNTGGPFAAAVFDLDSGNLLHCGVNLVESVGCSIAHAEVVALSLAQQALGTYDLSQNNRRCQLLTSTEPCAMCLGAICWSGVSSVVCAARDEDARRIGFDEGDKPTDWIATLTKRGIAVERDILRESAADVLKSYADSGGIIYNPKSLND
ncbi:MAG: nucleoside deaminase [Sedimentisphaerales bacterium]|nr:nucleoside deaminase [Sedimentisphaerales bacterium]